MVTLKDISKASGYSVTTVSKALNGYSDVNAETRLSIQRIAKRLGYVPNFQARGLVTKKTWTIGVVMDEISGIGLQHPLFAEVLDSFKKEVGNAGYDIMILSLYIGQTKMSSYLEHAKRKGVDGVFVIVTDYDSEEYQELSDSDIPCVVFDHLSSSVHNVSTDNEMGMRLAFEHVFNLGHYRIAHIYGSSITLPGRQRMTAYTNLLREYDIDYKSEYLSDGDAFSFEGGYQAMSRLIVLDIPPTAVLCASDLQAMGALRAIDEKGYRCPGDFSVVGFDGTRLNQYITPTLTSVRQDTNSIGSHIANILIQLMNGEKPLSPKIKKISPRLIIGKSTVELT